MTSPASVPGDERLRLFLALRVPEDVLDEVDRWRRQLTAGRLVAREHLHVTLAFLGLRPASELGAIVDALRGAALRSGGGIRLTLDRYRETRSVGMLVLADEGGRAASLADDLQGRLEALGVFRRERRPWLPHLTVVRWRDRPRLRPEPPPRRTFVPSDAAAYLSRLRPGGAEYRILASVVLGGNVGGE